MIGYLRGKILEKAENVAIIDVSGVGYVVFLTSTVLQTLSLGEEIRLFIHTHVREDALKLFGFRTQNELSLFETLLGVSGVGPKTAMNVMTLATPDELRHAISEGDSTVLTRISGIGKKTAERIVVELKEKVGAGAGSGTSTPDAEVIDALVGLGYKPIEAREALKQVKGSGDTGERIKAALKMLSK